VIPFAVGDGGRHVRVGRKVVELSDSIVRALWHGVLLIQFRIAMGEFSSLPPRLCGSPVLQVPARFLGVTWEPRRYVLAPG
jgi:hypothetical protein